ncbi:TspO/MBR family protein [Scytonema millei]|uniref:TspO/MBR family protein n=1 Tax=Scytonema millei VB511283 TaxID=1245923 RepID=A0A9X5E451_9CYAN|nr:TspO/MBR family protein [Scytonema millei]NHC34930.1 TspO/MBR family protein [Scytonema millei VB511283]
MIKSWMVIGAVTLLVALGSNFFTPSDRKWFKRLRRPNWLTFEALIPVIWTVVFICGAWSAYIVWENTGSWLLMGFYLLVEILIVSYTPVMFRTRSLKIGTIIGGTGAIAGLLLALTVLGVSPWAAALLLPYLIWSPIGTYTTWEMAKLNPQDV